MTLEQVSPEVITHNKNYNIITKKLITRQNDHHTNKIKVMNYANIVDLQDAFIEELNICFIYEFVSISLLQL